MFQQQAESEGVQPNHSNNMPNSISEEPINRLPSNLGGSAHQSQLFYMPNSSSEEPIHPLPSNLRGSSHQFDQLSEPESEPEEKEEAESEGLQPNVSRSSQSNRSSPGESESESESKPEIWTGERLNYYRQLQIAAQRGDWKSAKGFIDNDPNVLTAQITDGGRTLLHVAAIYWQWGFVLKLLERTSPESCVTPTRSGNTVLHYVVQGGSLKTAKALVQKNASLLQMVNDRGRLPLFISINRESKELIWHLVSQTRVDSPTFPFFRPELPGILCRLIESGHQDIALYYVRRYPKLAIVNDGSGTSLLYWLATNPSHFLSGSNLGFFERLIYKSVHVDIKHPTHSVMINMEDTLESISEGFATQALRWFKRLIWKTIAQLAPFYQFIKMVRDVKVKHECSVELVNQVCKQLSSMSFREINDFLQNPKRIMASAVTDGIEEIVRILFLHFPDLIDVRPMPERNILQAAIEHRQVKIFNIIKETHPSQTKNFSSYNVESESTILHLAGKLAPAFKLFSVPGAALQMQRELQWFKEVENITFSYQREQKNSNNETAKDVFRTEHNMLAEKGEKWMKDTANSCMLVSTLIATVLFAAAFTVPGGNLNDKGIPLFLRTKAFTVFAISNALGLFSSLTSLLMFLAILTARYEIDDFLESLPKKLIIGLGSLFVAIAAMIIAFGATLTIVLSERWNLVFVPITLLASFPVAMFVMLQLPLFIQMVQSTYGASMFCPWPSRV